MSQLYRPADLRTPLPKVSAPTLRSKARTLAPEAYDPGQVVREVLYSGVVWSLGPEQGRSTDSRWVACEDGIVRMALLSKTKDGELSFLRWMPAQCDYVPTGAQPFSVDEWDGGPADAPEQPDLFELAA